MNKYWYTDADERVDFAAIEKIVAEAKAVVIKQAAGSSGGHAVKFLEHSNDNFVGEFLKTIENISEDIIVQRPIVQHEKLMKLNDSSVNSLRIVSLLRENDVKIYSVVLRMGIAGMRVDNESSGGVNCGVRNNGTLRSIAHTKDTGKCYRNHPTSGIIFEGYIIPSYARVIETVKQMHPQIPHFRLVSWDFAIDEFGEPIFIEANLNCGGLHINQINNGPLFGDDTKQILDEVFRK